MNSQKSAKKMIFFCLFILFLCGIVKAQVAVVDASQVVFPVSVISQEGEFIDNLTQNQFSLTLGKKTQQINLFSNQDAPASIVILFDNSGSVKSRVSSNFRYLKEGLDKFIQSVNSDSEFALYTFSDEIQLNLNWTQTKEEVLKAFDKIGSGTFSKKTRILDACYAGLEKVKARKNLKRVVLLITDGKDSHSKHSRDELEQVCFETHVPIFSIEISELEIGRLVTPYVPSFQDFNLTYDLSKKSGGNAAYPLKKDDLQKTFVKFASYIRYQYWIGFVPTIKSDKPAKIEIKLASSDPAKKLNLFGVFHSPYHIQKK